MQRYGIPHHGVTTKHGGRHIYFGDLCLKTLSGDARSYTTTQHTPPPLPVFNREEVKEENHEKRQRSFRKRMTETGTLARLLRYIPVYPPHSMTQTEKNKSKFDRRAMNRSKYLISKFSSPESDFRNIYGNSDASPRLHDFLNIPSHLTSWGWYRLQFLSLFGPLHRRGFWFCSRCSEENTNHQIKCVKCSQERNQNALFACSLSCYVCGMKFTHLHLCCPSCHTRTLGAV